MLTACIIVRNESSVLVRCLRSLAGLADKLCIVDSGSTDNTVEIAKSFDAEVLVDPSLADAKGRMLDFSAARNAALRMANTDWVISIDADEVLHVEDHEALRLLLGEPTLQALEVRIHSGFSRWFLPRIFRLQPWTAYNERVHEWVEVRGRVHRTDDVSITNRPEKTGKESAPRRDLRLCAQTLREAPNNLRAVFYMGRALRMLGRHRAAVHFYEIYLREARFDPGRHAAAIGAAISCLLSTNYEGAREFGLRAHRILPEMAEACCIVGDAVLAMGQIELAREWFERARSKVIPGLDYPFFVDQSSYIEYPQERLNMIDSLTTVVAIDRFGQSGADL